MWASVLKWFANMLLLPLLKDGLAALGEYLASVYKKMKWTKEKKKEIETKVDDYAKAPTRDSSRDTFGKLP